MSASAASPAFRARSASSAVAWRSNTWRGRRCASTRPRIVDRDALFAKLLATLRAMHAAGVAHGDLKRKDNIIVGAGERPYLIDFGIAVRRSATSALWNRCVFEPLVQMDYNAWVKLKYGRRIDPEAEPGVLSAEDAALYRPLLVERVARIVRVPWQKMTLRRPRQRWRARRDSRDE